MNYKKVRGLSAFVVLGFFLMPGLLFGYESDVDEEFAISGGEQEKVVKVPARTDSDSQKAVDYKIGHRDLLEIKVFRAVELDRMVRVNESGDISMPLIGTVHLGGLTVTEAEQTLAARLGEQYMQNPHVSVFIREYESQKITVNGYVRSPGIYPIKGRLTLIQAISQAGGLDRLAEENEIVIFREKGNEGTLGYRVDFEEVQKGAVPDPVLQSSDIVVVPQNGSRAAFEDTTRTLRTFLGFVPFF